VRIPRCSLRRGHKGKIRAQLEQILWFTEYEEEIETDFAAIYGIQDVEELSGRKFVRFARRLIYYDGAVVKKMQIDINEESGSSSSPSQTTQTQGPTTKMSMGEAMKKYRGSGSDDLDALNYESESAMGGTLFERVTVPAK
jgi:hypothetical protein